MSACCGGQAHRTESFSSADERLPTPKAVGCLTDYLCDEDEFSSTAATNAPNHSSSSRKRSCSSTSSTASRSSAEKCDEKATPSTSEVTSNITRHHQRLLGKRNGHTTITFSDDLSSPLGLSDSFNKNEVGSEGSRRSAVDDTSSSSSGVELHPDLAYEQQLTANIQRQLDDVAENHTYRTALEEIAGEQYEQAYFVSYQKGEALGREAGAAVADMIKAAFSLKRKPVSL